MNTHLCEKVEVRPVVRLLSWAHLTKFVSTAVCRQQINLIRKIRSPFLYFTQRWLEVAHQHTWFVQSSDRLENDDLNRNSFSRVPCHNHLDILYGLFIRHANKARLARSWTDLILSASCLTPSQRLKNILSFLRLLSVTKYAVDARDLYPNTRDTRDKKATDKRTLVCVKKRFCSSLAQSNKLFSTPHVCFCSRGIWK